MILAKHSASSQTSAYYAHIILRPDCGDFTKCPSQREIHFICIKPIANVSFSLFVISTFRQSQRRASYLCVHSRTFTHFKCSVMSVKRAFEAMCALQNHPLKHRMTKLEDIRCGALENHDGMTFACHTRYIYIYMPLVILHIKL